MKTFFIFLFCVALGFLGSCTKFLDAKPDRSLEVPQTVADLQSLLDLAGFVNKRGLSFDEAGVDNYYLPETIFNSLGPTERAAHTWQPLAYNTYPNDWSKIYDNVNLSNIVLEGVDQIPRPTQSGAWDNVKGSALFWRGFSFLQGAWIFCKTFDAATAATDYGIALRLSSDMNAITTRATLSATYDQVLSDLRGAAALLPDQPQHAMRPSRAAAYGMLARCFLSMREYDSCGKYANLALGIKDDLMNFNEINLDLRKPFDKINKEVIFEFSMGSQTYFCFNPAYSLVDSNLYKSYDEHDLRKKGFFHPSGTGYSFKGNYSHSLWEIYIGLTTDELFLMRAEARARAGNTADALADLNHLLETRWESGHFVPYETTDSAEALQWILAERRKELIWRGLRWMDIKRLNKEGANITLTRKIGDQTFSLEPNADRYALPLPDDIIKMTGIPQNPY